MKTTLQTRKTPARSPVPSFSLARPGLLQRKCACGGSVGLSGECESCQKEKLLPNRVAGEPSMPEVPSIVHDVLQSPGQPLDPAIRAFMEPRFGHDFSQVRVHTDAKAATSAQAVKALAYTVGKDIIFGSGQYTATTREGRKLIAHELTHVIQQKHGQPGRLQKQDDTAPATALEEEAERTAIDVVTEGAAQETAAKPPEKGQTTCTRTILAEGSCADLVAKSKFICCDPDKGIERKGKKSDIEGTPCPDEKFTPIFTCDNNCSTALAKGCDDKDNWMAIPGNQFTKKQCGDVWTICANGKQTTGYVRDRSVTQKRFEVSPGIQQALGVTVGSSFKGAIYRPGAKQAIIDNDPCCKS